MASPAAAESSIGESRLPPAVALFVFMTLNVGLRIWLGNEGLTHEVHWLVPAIEVVLLVAILTADPSSDNVRARRMRRFALMLVSALVVVALASTAVLISDLIDGTGVSNDPSELLADAGVVWLGNNLAFALLYWMIDSGGPIGRMQGSHPIDFAFPQHLSPEVRPPGWRPVFHDYLYLGFTNATAFSPTDAMPLRHRVKYLMGIQATVSLILVSLVVARAVNAFT